MKIDVISWKIMEKPSIKGGNPNLEWMI